jgi:hypothetical protein
VKKRLGVELTGLKNTNNRMKLKPKKRNAPAILGRDQRQGGIAV